VQSGYEAEVYQQWCIPTSKKAQRGTKEGRSMKMGFFSFKLFF